MADARAVVRTADKKSTRNILDADTLLVAAGVKSTNSQDLLLTGASGNVSVAATNTFKGITDAIFDWSGSTGIFKTPTGVATFGGSSNVFTNNVDTQSGLDVTGAALTTAAGLTVSGGTLAHTGAAIDLDPTGAYTLDMDAGNAVTTTIADSLASSYLVQVGANAMIKIDTDTDKIELGNATTNPPLELLGSGDTTLGGDLDVAGNVGIGTTNPGRRLHVFEPTLDFVALFESGDSGGGIELRDNTTTASSVALLAIGNSFRIDAGGAERVRVTSSGNVGIGTTTPDELLSVTKTTNPIIRITTSGASTDAAVGGLVTFFGDSGVGRAGFIGFESSSNTNFTIWNEVGPLRFGAGEPFSSTPRMLIDNSGNVGIGTTTPTAKLDVNGDLVVNGNITQQGSSTSIALASEEVRVADNHLLLNDGYVNAVAQTGGLVVNNLPTATADTIAGAFVAGVAAVSNPTVVTTGSATFAADDIIMLSGITDAALVGNNGLFEVLSHVGTTLTVKGVGTTTTTFDEAQSDFDAGTPTGTPAITKITVGFLRLGTDGIPETATGSATPLSFTDLALVTSTTLQTAYDNDVDGSGATITTNSTDGDVIIAGTEKLLVSAAGGLDVSGSGPVILANGTLDVPATTSFKIGTVALTTSNWTAAHLSTLLDGALHTDGWTTTGLSVGEVASISANNTVVQADATSGAGKDNIEGILNLAGEVQQSGKFVGAQFVTGLTLVVGDRIFLSKTLGALTNDVSGFSVGDTVYPLGRVRDTTGYTGVDIPNSKATISLIQGEPGEA